MLEQHPAIASPDLRGLEPEILELGSVAVPPDPMPSDDRAVQLEHPHFVTRDIDSVELQERADSLEEGFRIGPVGLGTVGKRAQPRSLDRASASDGGGQSLASMRRTRSASASRTAVLTLGKSSIS